MTTAIHLSYGIISTSRDPILQYLISIESENENEIVENMSIHYFVHDIYIHLLSKMSVSYSRIKPKIVVS